MERRLAAHASVVAWLGSSTSLPGTRNHLAISRGKQQTPSIPQNLGLLK